MAAEVSYKLKVDVNNGNLVKITDFIQPPGVIEAEITLNEDRNFITPAQLYMVDNVHLKSSKDRMVAAPYHFHMITKQSINYALYSEHHGLPRLQKMIPGFKISVSIA